MEETRRLLRLCGGVQHVWAQHGGEETGVPDIAV